MQIGQHYNYFWKDTEDWSNDAENSALITVINTILKHILNRKSLF